MDKDELASYRGSSDGPPFPSAKQNASSNKLTEYITLAMAVMVCPSCNFRTKVNGRLEHDRLCPLKGSQKPAEGEVTVPREPTDLMRRAAWAVFPNCNAPYTEIYKAMLAAHEQETV